MQTNHIVFIQSVSGKEWEIGEIMHNAIKDNPEYGSCVSYLCYAKNFEELSQIVDAIINSIDANDNVIIQLVTHSNKDIIAFRDVKSQDANTWNDERSWNCVGELLEKLYRKYKAHALLISISCYSDSYFKSLNSHHINLIGSEGEISSHRAEEQLFTFYKTLNNVGDFELSYNAMIQKFPITEDCESGQKGRAIMRFFKAI